MRLFTIGHSTRTAEELVRLLAAHGVQRLADIRSVPRSARHPHFSQASLEPFVRARGIEYRHFRELGGWRRPRSDSPNTAWQRPGFRGYADYMLTPQFEDGLRELLAFAAEAPTALMCAEAVWWRCHRSLLADTLVARGHDVFHIVSETRLVPHRLSEFARVEKGRVTYPGLL